MHLNCRPLFTTYYWLAARVMLGVLRYTIMFMVLHIYKDGILLFQSVCLPRNYPGILTVLFFSLCSSPADCFLTDDVAFCERRGCDASCCYQLYVVTSERSLRHNNFILIKRSPIINCFDIFCQQNLKRDCRIRFGDIHCLIKELM